MKKLIRAVFRLLCLPFAVIFFLVMIGTDRIIGFFEWVYDANQSNYEKSITKEIFNDLKQGLKNSFKIF